MIESPGGFVEIDGLLQCACGEEKEVCTLSFVWDSVFLFVLSQWWNELCYLKLNCSTNGGNKKNVCAGRIH